MSLHLADLIEAGFAVYSTTRRDADDYPIGGRVWQVEPYADPSTGESGRRFFVVRTRGRRYTFEVLDSNEVDAESIERPNPATLRNLVRALGTQLGKSKGYWSAEDRQAVHAMYELTKSMDVAA